MIFPIMSSRIQQQRPKIGSRANPGSYDDTKYTSLSRRFPREYRGTKIVLFVLEYRPSDSLSR